MNYMKTNVDSSVTYEFFTTRKDLEKIETLEKIKQNIEGKY